MLKRRVNCTAVLRLVQQQENRNANVDEIRNSQSDSGNLEAVINFPTTGAGSQFHSDRGARREFCGPVLCFRHQPDLKRSCRRGGMAQEIARSMPGLKAAFERGFEEILSAQGGNRKEAIFQTAALLGGVVLARAVQDPQLSDEILDNVRQKVS